MFTFLKCFVGPVLTTQAGIMYRSVPARSVSGADVVAALLFSNTLGRCIIAGLGAYPTLCGARTILVAQVMLSALFLTAVSAALAVLNDATVLMLAILGGTAYGMMWTSDSPLFMAYAAAADDWQPIMSFVACPVELAGCLLGNYISGRLYDAHGFRVPGEGIVCDGPECFRGSFILMVCCSAICMMLAGALCFRDARRRGTSA